MSRLPGERRMGRHRGRIAWIAFVLAFAVFYLVGRWAAGGIVGEWPWS